MPLKIPPELKKITQYIRRAEELDRDKSPQSRIVAYYCRKHAVKIGIPLATSPATQKLMASILDDLEKEKEAMNNFTIDEAYSICRDFAFKVFDKADNIDRAGRSDKNTAKSFYAAASFLDVLSFFHDGKEEEEKTEEAIEEEKKSFYAKWKATDILKAIKEGREIKPGGFGETLDNHDGGDDDDGDGEVEPFPAEKEDEMQDTTPAVTTMPPPPPYASTTTTTTTTTTTPPSAPVAPLTAPPLQQPETAPQLSSCGAGGFMSSFFASLGVGGNDSSKYPKNVLDDAKELTKFALQALNEKDGDLAAQRLKQALEILAESQRLS